MKKDNSGQDQSDDSSEQEKTTLKWTALKKDMPVKETSEQLQF